MKQHTLNLKNINTIVSDTLQYVADKQTFILHTLHNILPSEDKAMFEQLQTVIANNNTVIQHLQFIKEQFNETSQYPIIVSDAFDVNTIEAIHVLSHFAVSDAIKNFEKAEQFLFSNNITIRAERTEENKKISQKIFEEIQERQTILALLRKDSILAYQIIHKNESEIKIA
ncbi:MAG: hypothetical protein RSN61_21320 [Chryseobacterium sp.]|uniref:hypothetical protein n=1 Tax=Chryseobacterium sp. TaxID=1871047 RepID=UPI002FCBA094